MQKKRQKYVKKILKKEKFIHKKKTVLN